MALSEHRYGAKGHNLSTSLSLLSFESLTYTIRNYHGDCCNLVNVLKAEAVARDHSHAPNTPTFPSNYGCDNVGTSLVIIVSILKRGE